MQKKFHFAPVSKSKGSKTSSENFDRYAPVLVEVELPLFGEHEDEGPSSPLSPRDTNPSSSPPPPPPLENLKAWMKQNRKD